MINYVYNGNPDLGTRRLSQTSSYVFQLHIMSPHWQANIICWYSHISRVRCKHVKRFKKIMTVFLGLSVYSKADWGTTLVVQRLGICLPKWGHRFGPWDRRIQHAMGQLSPRITTTGAQEQSVLCSRATTKGSHAR